MRLNAVLSVLAGAALALAGTGAAQAAAPSGQQQVVLDPATGRVLSGPAGGVSTARAGSAELAAVAQTRQVGDCGSGNPYWNILSSGPTVCLADAGDIDLTVPTTYQVGSGNNTGWFTWTNPSGQSFKTTISAKWVWVTFNTVVTVRHVHID